MFFGLQGVTYEPTNEEKIRLTSLLLLTAWAAITDFINNVEAGTISRTTGAKIVDLGDFDLFNNGRYDRLQGCFIVLDASQSPNNWQGTIYANSVNGTKDPYNNTLVPGTRRTGQRIKSQIGDPYNFSAWVLRDLVSDFWDRPNADNNEVRIAVSNEQPFSPATVQQYVTDVNTAITQAQQAFQAEVQTAAIINTATDQLENTQLQLTQQSDAVIDQYGQQQFQQLFTNQVYDQYRPLVTSGQLQTQQTLLNQTQQIAKQSALPVVQSQNKALTTATNRTGTTAAKNLANNTSTGTKLATSATARAEDIIAEDADAGAEKKTPTWVWIAAGVAGVGIVGGGGYYLYKKSKKGKKGRRK